MEFDPRMNEETKEFVAKVSHLFPVLFADVKMGREILDAAADESNSKIKFNVEEKEFLVPSLYDDYEIPITAYVPKNVLPKSSIVVFFHGGGYKMFSRKTHRNSIAFLAENSNKIWVSIEYRYSPEFKHPTQLNDCESATKWILDNKTKELHASNDAKIGVCGDSCGGNLATSVAFRLKNLISFQVLIYPWLDFTGTSEIYKQYTKPMYLLTDELLSGSVRDVLSDPSDAASADVSPVFRNDLAGSPKCFILSAELDQLFGDALTYNKKLHESGVESEIYVVKGAVHSFFHAFFELMISFREGAFEIVKFLNKID